MMGYVLLALAILPVLVIGTYVNRKDRTKEPTSILVKLFISGILSCFVVLFVSNILSSVFPILSSSSAKTNLIEMLIYAFIGVALVEEGSKLLMVYNIGYKNKEFDEIYDIIIYSVFVALGFAAFENILYVLGNETIEASITTGVLRAILAVPGHACDGLFMGYYLSLAKISELQNQKEESKKNLLKSLLIPTILHGTYDFCIFTGMPIFLLVFLVFVIWMYINAIKKLKLVATNNRSLYRQNKYCAYCGAQATGVFCGHCGHKIQ